MAGIEQLEIHSKSYIVRWVKVDDGYTVSWSVQPHKKSINFGIVKHPGSGGTNLTTSNHSEYTLAAEGADGAAEGRSANIFSKRDVSTARDQLSKKGFIMVKWHGKCAADKVSTGTHDVTAGNGGMFGMIFDNTFSKQTSKNATFVVLTYPTGSAPQPGRSPNLMPVSHPASSSRTSLPRHHSPLVGVWVGPGPNESLDSLHSHAAGKRGTSVASQSGAGRTTPATHHTGLLLKRRRKRGQGFARRFFSLDFATCTLSYYQNRNSSALRGAIPLSLAAIAADERRRELSIDSGAEIWHLKASSDKDFAEWANALTQATRIARGAEQLGDKFARDSRNLDYAPPPPNNPQEEDREWQQVETLVSRVVGTRDALHRLVKDMSTQNAPRTRSPKPATPSTSSGFLSPGTPVASDDVDGYFHQQVTPTTERRHFWQRKSSASVLSPAAFQQSLSPQLAVPSPGSVSTITPDGQPQQSPKHHHKPHIHEGWTLQDNCRALLGDLDSVVADFTRLLSTSKRRRMPVAPSAASRHSIESTSTEEFFDAAEGGEDRSALLLIDNHSDDSPRSDEEEVVVHDSSSESSTDDDDDDGPDVGGERDQGLFPPKPKSLAPLPITIAVTRRRTIPPATVPPPSLIASVRKNVGKDLSTITMPVSSNEPISLLQRMAEQLEYAHLLDAASKQKEARDRLLYVAAFAVSQYSSGRAKERAIRKPFNPLLGETFELLCADGEVPGGMRLLAEKVSHRPVRLAIHADGSNWSFAQAPAPTNKFWGKSMELTTEGRVRISLRLQGAAAADGATAEEYYSFASANMFLRNVVMGEKYVEPSGTMTVVNDTTGAKAVVEFRNKGMFGGRSEDVQVETFGPDGMHTGVSLAGTWTSGLRVVEAGKTAGAELWTVGKLVDNSSRVYGLTAFAAGLNEVTELEKGRLPITDTRLRPDQRLAEEGKLDDAEEWKNKLEEAQRRRRREMEERGEQHRPRWFVKASDAGDGGDEVWRLKGGKDGYWEERAKGVWTGVDEIFTE